MNKIHCDGCGMTEAANTPKPKIKKVSFSVVEDPRWSHGIKDYIADLCGHCQGGLLHNYFGISAAGELELPAFIEPRSLKAVR